MVMDKAAHYGRVSGKGQVKGFGLDRQRLITAEYAENNGLEIVVSYEEAYTGTEADRPRFIEMLEFVQEHGIKIILVESLDRLAREVMVQITLLAKLESLGITLISASTGEDVTASMRDDPMREALVIIQGVFAMLDKKLLVRKLRKGRQASKAKHGRCEGVKPFGSLPGEETALGRIVELHKGGFSNPLIADQLNREGIKTRKGGEWKPGTVWQITKRLNSKA